MKFKIKQILLSLLAISLSSGITLSFAKTNNVKFENNNFQTLPKSNANEKSYYFGNSKPNISKSVNQKNIETTRDLKKETIYGSEYGKPAIGLHLTTGGYKPPFMENITDFINSKNNVWYTVESQSAKLNYLEYANSKEDFIVNYEYLTASVFVTENFWNQSQGWSWSDGHLRNASTLRNLRLQLSGKNKTHDLWYNSDHNYNEQSKVALEEIWNENEQTLSLVWKISLNLKNKSVNRSAIVKIRNPQFNFRFTTKLNNPDNFVPSFPDDIIGFSKLWGNGINAGISMDLSLMRTFPNWSSEISLDNWLNSIDLIEKENYRIALMFNQTFTFMASTPLGLETMSLQLAANSLLSLDTNYLLNQELPITKILEGSLKYHIDKDKKSFFTYTSKISGKTEQSNIVILDDGSSQITSSLAWSITGTATYYYEKK